MSVTKRQIAAFARHTGFVIRWSAARWWSHHGAVAIASGIIGVISFTIGYFFHHEAIERWPFLESIAGPPSGELVKFICYAIIPAALVASAVFGFFCLVAPSQIHLEQQEQLQEMQKHLNQNTKGIVRLEKIGVFQHVVTSPIIGAVPSPGGLVVVFFLRNVSDLLIAYTMHRLSIKIVALSKESLQGPFPRAYLHSQSQTEFHSEPVVGVDWHLLESIHLLLSYEIRYDTDPPTRPRVSTREITVTGAKADPGGSGDLRWVFPMKVRCDTRAWHEHPLRLSVLRSDRRHFMPPAFVVRLSGTSVPDESEERGTGLSAFLSRCFDRSVDPRRGVPPQKSPFAWLSALLPAFGFHSSMLSVNFSPHRAVSGRSFFIPFVSFCFPPRSRL